MSGHRKKGSYSRGARCAFKHDELSRVKGKRDKRQRTPSPTKRQPTYSDIISQQRDRHKPEARQAEKVPTFSVLKKKKTMQIRNELSLRPLRHRSPIAESQATAKNTIAKCSAGGYSLQGSQHGEKTHAEGNLTRHKTQEFEDTVQWSACDMKVAYFQMSTSVVTFDQKRKWHERCAEHGVSRRTGTIQSVLRCFPAEDSTYPPSAP